MNSNNIKLNYLLSVTNRVSYLMVIAGPILLGLSATRLLTSSFYLPAVVVHFFLVLFSILIHFRIIKTSVIQQTTFYICSFSIIGFMSEYINHSIPHGVWMITISMAYCSLVYDRIHTVVFLIFNEIVMILIAKFFKINFTILDIAGPSVFIYFIVDAFYVAKEHILLNSEKVGKLNKELNQIVLSRNQFFANLTHELRTPLSGILGGIGTIKYRDEEQKSQIQLIEYSANHLLDVVNEILDYTKLEQKKLILDLDKVSIRKEIENIIESNRFLIMNKKIEFISQIDVEDDVTGMLDIYRLKQVLNNIIGNAVKFTKAGQVKILVTLVKEEDGNGRIFFNISDTGIGIAQDKLDNIFNPFSQESSKIAKQFGGTGLGLSISKQILELFGGTLSIESEVGRGTVFNFYFPIDLKSIPKLKNTNNLTMDEIKNFNSERKTKCIVVDDNVINLELMKRFLENFNVEVEIFSDSEEALVQLKNKKYDIIFLDYLMPKISGDQLAIFIRSNSQQNSSFVVGISANEFDFEVNVFPGDINKFISKPINRAQLVKVFQEYVEFNQSHPS